MLIHSYKLQILPCVHACLIYFYSQSFLIAQSIFIFCVLVHLGYEQQLACQKLSKANRVRRKRTQLKYCVACRCNINKYHQIYIAYMNLSLSIAYIYQYRRDANYLRCFLPNKSQICIHQFVCPGVSAINKPKKMHGLKHFKMRKQFFCCQPFIIILFLNV